MQIWPKRLRNMSLSRRDWLMFVLGLVVTLAGVEAVTLINHGRAPLRPETPKVTIAWLPSTVKRWEGPINEMAKQYNIDPNYLAIIMTLESGGNPKAISEANAKGLMQITPPTAKDIAAKYLKKPTTHYNLSDPQTNIEFGAAYLAILRDNFGNWQQGPDWNVTAELVAAGYNGGPGAANRLDQGKGLTDPQTVIYSRDVYNMWRERHARTSPTYERWFERGGSRLIDAAKAQH